MVLDGLERVLVAYHRHDAAQLPDEQADTAADQIGKRDPCAAIRPEDDDLLRRLAAAAPSKILVSSRLTPMALVNRSGLRVPGVRREILPGLRPPDAEAMIRACGVMGSSQAIQAYPPDRGNFDRWAEDPRHGGALNLADLDLVQRRNHILMAAIDALTPESRQLLQTLALLQAGADFETLEAFNPHLPQEPEEVAEPADPIHDLRWSRWVEKRRAGGGARYEERLAQRQAYVEALATWKGGPAVRAAPVKLGDTIRDLEKRGLLQYDLNGKRYDLHAVVRGVAAGRMAAEETQKLGQRVADFFSSQPHTPWERAETLEDLAPGLQVTRVFLRMQRYEEALNTIRGDLAVAMLFNLHARTDMQAVLRPFFPNGWDGETVPLTDDQRAYLINEAVLSLKYTHPDQAMRLSERHISLELRRERMDGLVAGLYNSLLFAQDQNRQAISVQLSSLIQDLAEAIENDGAIFVSKLRAYELSFESGDHVRADCLWRELEGMSHEWPRSMYRAGNAEMLRAVDLLFRGELTEEFLARAETLAKSDRNRHGVRQGHRLRGEWRLARNEPAQAVESLAEYVRMERESGRGRAHSEALLALARLRAGEQFNAPDEADRLTKSGDSAALTVAELWHALGDHDRAVELALRAHHWALADGEPYVHRYYLNRTRALLADLRADMPKVPRYDPSKAIPYPWEKDVRAFIDKLRVEKTKKTKHKARRKKSPKSDKI